MSYSMSLYAVSISDLKAACQSPRPELMEAIRSKHGDGLSSQDGDDGLTVGEALELLLAGRAIDSTHASQAGYALELLCDVLGTRMECPGLAETSLGFMTDVLNVSDDCAESASLLSARPPVSIGLIADFPAVGHLTLAELRKTLSEWTEDAVEHPIAEVTAARCDVFECFARAVELEQDVVSFCY